MAYTVLARRYRSQSFDDVVGQEAIARTLRNAIATGRVAHAYLFTGTRGVGKTSLARIFARALNAPDTIPNCPKPPRPDSEQSEDRDAFPELDIQQRMAEAIMRGEDLNVIEIDGASNNSVEQARQLISNAGLSPTANARYKIYIIDEVHMLSNSAFNALLKTMEEPPAHVKFILCTTEPHKVPATIHSRCQRFDFRNIPSRAIAGHLKDVLSKEGIDAEDDVVFQLAVLGNGSMRDALSLLDRLIATGQSPLTAKTLEEMLGLPASELIASLIDAFATGNPKAALETTHDLLMRGISQDQLIEVLVTRLRQLMLISACGPDSELVELSDEARRVAAQQAERFDAPALVHMIALCENLQRHSKSSSNPRALLDATVVRLALAEKMADVTAVLAGQTPPASKKKVAEPPQSVARASASPPAPAAARPAPPLPAAPVTPQTPGEVWATLQQRVGSIPSMAFVDHLCMVSLEQNRVTIEALPGHADIARFARMERNTKRLADELMTILGRRVEVVTRDRRADDPSPEPAASPARHGGVSTLDKRAAMELPLVRDALDVFGDATPIAFREEAQPDPIVMAAGDDDPEP